jgi:hypothetical protein
MSTEEVELEGIEESKEAEGYEGLDYIREFKDRLDLTILCIDSRRDITENDYAVLWEIYRISRDGNLPFFIPSLSKMSCTESATTTTEFDLFSQSVSSTMNGIEVETDKENDKKESNGNKKIQK